jgi:hypothetical protein
VDAGRHDDRSGHARRSRSYRSIPGWWSSLVVELTAIKAAEAFFERHIQVAAR